MKELSATARSKSPTWADPPQDGHQHDDREADDEAWQFFQKRARQKYDDGSPVQRRLRNFNPPDIGRSGEAV
jgi:hypothetical protein